MKKIILLLSVTILLSGFISENGHHSKGEKSGKGKKQTNSESKKLFNGHDLEGWYTFVQKRGRNNDPKKVFTVSDGMIRISGEEWGCITTEKEFENYHLTIEFKWGKLTFDPRLDKARDSGVLLHSIGEDGASSEIWMNSIECQVIEGGTGDFIVVGDGTDKFSVTSPVAAEKQNGSWLFKPDGKFVTINEGRINWYGRDPQWKDTKEFRGANDVEKPVGQWNKLECIADGNDITIILNGKKVNYATKVQPSKGKIQIQSEGAEIFVRKVEMKEIR